MKNNYFVFDSIIFATVILLGIALIMFFIPSSNFHTTYPRIFVVDKGDTIREVGQNLYEDGIISSVSAFILSTHVSTGKVLSGAYHIDKPKGTFFLAKSISTGNRNAPVKRLQVREQSTIFDVTEFVTEKFPEIDKDVFIKLALQNNGMLYPDTYFFPKDEQFSEEEIINIMRENFERKINPLFENYQGEYSKEDVIKLASILELEAINHEDRRMIAGVLINRLEQDIPLQVDVSFRFINGKGTFELSTEDLKTANPYNSYTELGLPPTPIATPTVSSVQAALSPIASDNLFFLADLSGTTYFSETLAEHNRKKSLYLK